MAFSGKVKLPDDETEYTEASLNGFPEDQLPKEFDTDAYQVLLVANKYQTGFDQPKLCAMYVLKKLRGVNAVQTLSRLNRICPPYDKKTFVLDFVNSYEDMKVAFAPYYTTTLLSNSVTPSAIYDLEAKIDAYALFDPADIDSANEILYSEKITSKQKQRLTFFLQKSKKLLDHYEYEEQRQAVADMRSFVRYYEFSCKCPALRIMTCIKSIILSLIFLHISTSSIQALDLTWTGKFRHLTLCRKKEKNTSLRILWQNRL